MSDKKDLIVVKANSLIEASYRLSIDEIRILALTVGRMDPKSNQKVFEFSISDVVREFPDIGIENAYKQMQVAVKKLYDRSVRTEDESRVTDFRWVSSRSYFKKEGRFKIVLTDEVMPYLTQLKGQFTQYELRNISTFSSVHSIRIYELLTQYKNLGKREILVDDLKDWLQVSDKYDRYNNFNQRVLTPAIDEINAKSDLLVSVEPLKRGRTITALLFTISVKKTAIKAEVESKEFKLPKRPQVKAGTHLEGVYLTSVRDYIYDYYKTKHNAKRASDIFHLIPKNHLEILYKTLKKLGDSFIYQRIEKILNPQKKETTEKPKYQPPHPAVVAFMEEQKRKEQQALQDVEERKKSKKTAIQSNGIFTDLSINDLTNAINPNGNFDDHLNAELSLKLLDRDYKNLADVPLWELGHAIKCLSVFRTRGLDNKLKEVQLIELGMIKDFRAELKKRGCVFKKGFVFRDGEIITGKAE